MQQPLAPHKEKKENISGNGNSYCSVHNIHIPTVAVAATANRTIVCVRVSTRVGLHVCVCANIHPNLSEILVKPSNRRIRKCARSTYINYASVCVNKQPGIYITHNCFIDETGIFFIVFFFSAHFAFHVDFLSSR